MSKSNIVMLGDVPVGDGCPTLFVAETGTFFNKDIELALQYVDDALEAGVKVFKTEILHDANICLPGTGLEHQYTHAHGRSIEDYRSLIERKIVSLEDYQTIFETCHDKNIEIMASVYDKGGVDFVIKNGGCAVKIARNNINNIPLIRYAAASMLPMIFDMGDVYLDEIALAVRVAKETGNDKIIVNLHPGANPAPADMHHLRTAITIKSMFNTPVGLSCHFRGEEILYAAAGAGINLIEKGVDIDPDRDEQDLVSALPVSKLRETVEKLHSCWSALGNTYPKVDQDRDLTVRAGIYITKDITKGGVLSEDNMSWAFPPLGISIENWDSIMGSTVNQDLKAGDVLHWKDIIFNA